jgi:NADH dehydrogenase
MLNELNIPTLEIPRVVILGGGFAGLKLARKLNSKFVQTVLIDENNYHTFQPLMYQVATAGLEPDSIAYPLRKILKNKKRTHIRMAEVQRIIPEHQVISTSIGDLHYDYLVIATGAKTNYFGNAHIEEHAMPMKGLTQSLDLRSAILQKFEAALNENDLNARDSLMHFVIVGGGPTGVELAGALAELRAHVLPKDYPDLDLRRMQISVIEAGTELLGTMSSKASANAKKYLTQLDINIYTDTMVMDYNGKTISTSNQELQSRTLIWAAGVKGNIPEGLAPERIDHGRIKVDGFGFVEGSTHILAIGDVAQMFDEATQTNLPMLASVAQQQGAYVAKTLIQRIREQPVTTFQYVDKGTMATIGRNKAVVDMRQFRFGGFFAWITWLFVHLMLLIDFRNRIIVLMNWIWSYINFDRGTRLIVRKYPDNLSSSDEHPHQHIDKEIIEDVHF